MAEVRKTPERGGGVHIASDQEPRSQLSPHTGIIAPISDAFVIT